MESSRQIGEELSDLRRIASSSGIYAARAIFKALKADDVSGAALASYDRMVDGSYIRDDLYRTRNMRLAFKSGFVVGGAKAGLMELTRGRLPGGRIPMHEDAAAARRHMAWKVMRVIEDPACAHRGWVYTFEKFRRRGVSGAATDRVVDWCREQGIRRIHSSRGVANQASVRMGDRLGFRPHRLAYQIQILGQRRHQGLYLLRPLR